MESLGRCVLLLVSEAPSGSLTGIEIYTWRFMGSYKWGVYGVPLRVLWGSKGFRVWRFMGSYKWGYK